MTVRLGPGIGLRHIAAYPVIALPPSENGGVKLTMSSPVAPTTVLAIVGAPGGTAIGVTLLDAAEAALIPTALVAVTVKV